MLFELKVRGSNTSLIFDLRKSIASNVISLMINNLKRGYKMTKSSQSFIKFKNLNMKLSSTILSYFSATHGFNTGMSQTVWTRKKGNGLDTGLQNTVSV